MDNQGQADRQVEPPDSQDTELKITWDEFGKIVNTFLLAIPRYDTIVAVANGGLVIGSVLAKMNDANFVSIRMKHYDGKKKLDSVRYEGFDGDLKGKVLVVDDIADTGETLIRVQRFIHSCDTLTLFRRSYSKVKPNYCLSEVDKWIVFPWEVER